MSQLIVCLDFDGTLVGHEDRIHPADAAILSTRSDVLFIPATGRPLHGVRHGFDAAGIFLGEEIPLPMVLLNGATTFLPGEAICEFTPFPVSIQQQLVSAALEAEAISSFFFGFDSLDIVHPAPFSDVLMKRFGLNGHPFNADQTQPRFAKLMAIAENPEPLKKLAADLAELEVEMSFSMPTVLEVNVKGVNKGERLSRLIAAMGIEDARIFTAGDGENDFPLFDLAERIFVPVDSPESIRKRADQIVDSSYEGLLTPILRAAEIL